jgi:CheY-like chemotaxis protein
MTAVIYIDDDPNNVTLVTRILLKRRADLLVRTATTARDGLELATAELPRLILLDRRLPDMLGTEVLRRLKAAPGTAAIPVVMLSGDSGREHTEEFKALGAVDFLAKPFEINDLMAIIDRFCQ